jgi:hypothetical protein
MRRFFPISLLALGLLAYTHTEAAAQPLRQVPGARPFLAHAKQITPPQVPNRRRRPAASQVGFESTDFYIKNGYPKQLGDFFEQGSTVNGNTGNTGQAGQAAAGNTGNTGVQSSGSQGFQGNTGNQIGNQGGGTIFGGLFGGNNFNAGNGGALGGNPSSNSSFTGGGFSGAVPKGFGFAGTPDLPFHRPMHGVHP